MAMASAICVPLDIKLSGKSVCAHSQDRLCQPDLDVPKTSCTDIDLDVVRRRQTGLCRRGCTCCLGMKQSMGKGGQSTNVVIRISYMNGSSRTCKVHKINLWRKLAQYADECVLIKSSQYLAQKEISGQNSRRSEHSSARLRSDRHSELTGRCGVIGACPETSP